jgi:hypothetical protein
MIPGLSGEQLRINRLSHDTVTQRSMFRYLRPRFWLRTPKGHTIFMWDYFYVKLHTSVFQHTHALFWRIRKKLRKTIISFVKSVCLSVRPHYREILYLEFLLQSLLTFTFCLKSYKFDTIHTKIRVHTLSLAITGLSRMYPVGHALRLQKLFSWLLRHCVTCGVGGRIEERVEHRVSIKIERKSRYIDV